MQKFCEHLVVFSSNNPEYSAELTPGEKCIRGRPEQRTWNHFTADDGRFFAGIWEGDPGCIKIDYTENEFCRLLEGEVILRDANGAEVTLCAGEEFVIPAGFSGEWETVEKVRKLYVIYQP
jgi:uncharacterized protein